MLEVLILSTSFLLDIPNYPIKLFNRKIQKLEKTKEGHARHGFLEYSPISNTHS